MKNEPLSKEEAEKLLKEIEEYRQNLISFAQALKKYGPIFGRAISNSLDDIVMDVLKKG